MNALRHTLLLVALGGAALACRSEPPPPEPVVVQAVRIELVETPNLVCMVNDQLMGKQQIPVVVEGRTYFGCCPGCKQKLEQDVRARTAVDPVTKKPVDKAAAVIGVKPNGDVLYFESRDTFDAYLSNDRA